MTPNENLVIPSQTPPSFWNKSTLLGFLLAGPLGLVVGGYLGKKDMEKEWNNGKEVSEPTIWNKNMLIGAALAFQVGVALSVGLISAGMVVGLPVLPVIGGVALLGGLIGGTGGKEEMEREYAQAVALKQEHQGMGTSRLLNSEYMISPEEAALLESRLTSQQGNRKNFAEQVVQRREQTKIEGMSA